MTTVVLAWPLKRSAIARLQQYADQKIPAPASVAAIVGAQVATTFPADPDRQCVYAASVTSTRRLASGEGTLSVETVRLEIRVRVYVPGEGDADIGDVDTAVGNLCQAVASALIDYEPVVDKTMGTLQLYQIVQWPTAVTPYPEPSATGMASVYFQADVITT